MIHIKIPFRGQGVVEMNNWIQDNGLVFRRDWEWDSSSDWDSSESCYIYSFSPNFSKIASMFALQWS